MAAALIASSSKGTPQMPVSDKKNLTNVKAIVFDYGEVLCLPPTAEDVESSARVLGVSTDLYRDLWARNRDLYDRGDLSPETYWRNLADDAGVPLNDAQLRELSDRDVVMWSRLNPNMVAWLEALSSGGIKTAILSNMHIGMVQHARRAFPWLKVVHFLTLSAEVRLIKPDPAIYEHCLRGLGVAPSDSLFIDDRAVNIAGARTVGMHAVQFQSIAQLRSHLEGGKFRILPFEDGVERIRPA